MKGTIGAGGWGRAERAGNREGGTGKGAGGGGGWQYRLKSACHGRHMAEKSHVP